jgi:hypothetical protein
MNITKTIVSKKPTDEFKSNNTYSQNENKQEQSIYKLIDLVNATPQIGWDWDYLSESRNLWIDDIISHISPNIDNSVAPFRKAHLSLNPNITLDFVLRYPDTPTEIMLSGDGYTWSWEYLTSNKNISIYDIIKNIDLPWDFKKISFKNLKLKKYDFLLQHSDKGWNKYDISVHVPFSFILAHPKLSYNLELVSLNESVTFTDVISNPNFGWNYNCLSAIIPLQILTTQQIFKINYEYLSANQTLTSEYLLTHLDEKWTSRELSDNENLNFDVLAKSDLELSYLFDFDILAFNISVTKSFIAKYYDYFSFSNFTILFDTKKIVISDFEKYPIFNHYILIILEFGDINLDYLKFRFPNKTMDMGYWKHILLNKNIKLQNLLEIANWFNKKIDYRLISNNPYLTYDFIYAHAGEQWNPNILEHNSFTLEYRKRLLIQKIKTKFLNISKKKILHNYLIPDLNNIIIEY